MNTVVRKYSSTAPRSFSASSTPQHSAAKAMVGMHRVKGGRLEKPLARQRISIGFMNSLGCTVMGPTPTQLRAPNL